MSEPEEVKVEEENHILKDENSSEICSEIENDNRNDIFIGDPNKFISYQHNNMLDNKYKYKDTSIDMISE